MVVMPTIGECLRIPFSRSPSRSAHGCGPDDCISMEEDSKLAEHHARSVDLIISAVSSPDMPLEQYLQLLRLHGTFNQVGAPEDKMLAFKAFALIAKGVRIGGSAIGAAAETRVMLDLTLKRNLKAWINARPFERGE
ncbi:MAG: hypothetical protein Q9178_007097 [Gyalolechia marmorata]